MTYLGITLPTASTSGRNSFIIAANAANLGPMVTIPGGTFMMGSDAGEAREKPRHRVKIKTFKMAKTLVTNKQYKVCVDAGVCTKVDSAGSWFEETSPFLRDRRMSTSID